MDKISISRVLVLCCCFIGSAVSKPAVADDPSFLRATVLLSNPGNSANKATFYLYDDQGAAIDAAVTQQTLPAKGTKLLALPVSAFAGGARVMSDHPLVVLQLGVDGNSLPRDIHDGAGAAATLEFPAFRHRGDQETTGITVQNTSATDTIQVVLHCIGGDGKEQCNYPQALAPFAQYTYDSKALFGSTATAYGARIEASGPVASVEQVNLPSASVTFGGIIRNDQGVLSSYVPVVAHSGRGVRANSWSEVYVRNLGTSATDLTLTYYSAAGRKQTSQNSTAVVGGVVLFDTKKLKKMNLSGYAVLTQSGGEPLAVQWLALNKAGRGMLGGLGVQRDELSGNWACGDVRRQKRPAQYTRLNLLNPSDLKTTATVDLYNPETGSRMSSKSFRLKGKTQTTVKLATAGFRATSKNFSGLAMVNSQNGADLLVNAIDDLPHRDYSGYVCHAVKE